MITVEHNGFSTSKQDTAQLQVGQQLTLDFSLLVAGSTESVVVNAQTEQLPTESAVGLNIGTAEVDALPTSNRNFAGLAALSPESALPAARRWASTRRAAPVPEQRVCRRRAQCDEVLRNPGGVFPQDWIQEFQVMTNGFAPEFGNASGAFLNVITRSGTNDIHGRVYGFFQNAVFNSPPYAGRFARQACLSAPARRTTTSAVSAPISAAPSMKNNVLLRRLRRLRQQRDHEPFDLALLDRARDISPSSHQRTRSGRSCESGLEHQRQATGLPSATIARFRQTSTAAARAETDATAIRCGR